MVIVAGLEPAASRRFASGMAGGRFRWQEAAGSRNNPTNEKSTKGQSLRCFFGRSVIMGFRETQEYQGFTGSWFEVLRRKMIGSWPAGGFAPQAIDLHYGCVGYLVMCP